MGRPEEENALTEATQVASIERKVELPGKSFRHAFPGNSLAVLRIRTRGSASARPRMT